MAKTNAYGNGTTQIILSPISGAIKGVEKMLEVLKIIMFIMGIIILIPTVVAAIVGIYDFIRERLYDFEIWLSLKFDK
jgi:hypothetical protein